MRSRSALRGFTLLEVMVVVVILAIVATMAIPRLTGNEKRAFRHTIEQVADLLTMYAQREQLGQKVVGIYHDRQQNWLRLMVLDHDEDMPLRNQASWRDDRYVQPVKLPPFMQSHDVIFLVDGREYDAGEWPLSTEIGQARPQIEIILRGPNDTARIAMSPHGVAPMIVSEQLNMGVLRSSIDLNRAGRGREDW